MKKQNLSTSLLVLAFFLGLFLLLYPTVSNWWNSRMQSRAIVNYDAAVADLSHENYDAEFAEADAYNQALRSIPTPFINYEQVEGYYDILNVAGNGVMGYIHIPRINVELPIYPGISDRVLNTAVGHLEGTSLPVGGEGNHCVLSAHRGMPSAKLFTHLDKLTEGDTFTITILDRILTYEVDQIRIVEPKEITALDMVEGKDYVTLLTCTPYGINTHRLLVRGHRVETKDTHTVRVTADAMQIKPMLVAPIVAVPMLLVLLVLLMVSTRKKKRN